MITCVQSHARQARLRTQLLPAMGSRSHDSIKPGCTSLQVQARQPRQRARFCSCMNTAAMPLPPNRSKRRTDSAAIARSNGGAHGHRRQEPWPEVTVGGRRKGRMGASSGDEHIQSQSVARGITNCNGGTGSIREALQGGSSSVTSEAICGGKGSAAEENSKCAVTSEVTKSGATNGSAAPRRTSKFRGVYITPTGNSNDSIFEVGENRRVLLRDTLSRKWLHGLANANCCSVVIVHASTADGVNPKRQVSRRMHELWHMCSIR